MNAEIASIRQFNRFFSRLVGALDASFLGTGMTLGEARLLFEIAHTDWPLASALEERLDMDPGFVSRLIRGFEARGWIIRGHDPNDRRNRPIGLTPEGRAAFEDLDARQRAEVVRMLEGLSPTERRELTAALGTARRLLGDASEEDVTLRTFQAGDVGMITARQSILYRGHYGWSEGIEINEMEVAAAFLRTFKPGREQCWVAEIAGVMAGSIFLTDEGDGQCRLRLLYVEPFAQGRGIGNMLVETCLSFAREAGYQRMTLWTHTILESARRIYAAHGFAICDVSVHETFGSPMQGETWELDLTR